MKKLGFSKPLIIIGGVILAVIIFLPSYYFYSKYNSLKKTVSGNTEKDKNSAKELIAKVGKLIELPTGEEPTIATVSDKSALPGQPFFAKAQNGDQVLIYAKAKKAFLYRPSTGKLIEVGPVTINELSPTVSASPEASISLSPTVRVTDVISPTVTSSIKTAIYNASQTKGLAATTEQNLKSKFTNLAIVEKSNSSEDYTENTVIDLSGKNSKLVGEIAAFIKGKVSTIPATEVKPSADILVIVIN